MFRLILIFCSFLWANANLAQDTIPVEITWKPVAKKKIVVQVPAVDSVFHSGNNNTESSYATAVDSAAPAAISPCKTFADGLYHMKNSTNRDVYWYIKNDIVVEKDVVSQTEFQSHIIWTEDCEFVLKYTKLKGTTTKNLGDKTMFNIDKVNGKEYTITTAFRGIEIKEILVKEE
jgi:hypothetical protein